jgi:predicted NUDIX family NTP pyrophosphohydrolase
MSKKSAGLLLFRKSSKGLEVFLVHPGGPFWANKDEGSWSIPKGEFNEEEEPLAAAIREFKEETGFTPCGNSISLEPIKQPSGKIVFAWAMECDIDPEKLKSNIFSLEWPPKSGKIQEFPEVDRGGWFTLESAGKKILKGQAGFLEQLVSKNSPK